MKNNLLLKIKFNFFCIFPLETNILFKKLLIKNNDN